MQEHDNASTADQAAKWEEQRQVSRYAANLPQLETGLGRFGRQIPSDPSSWACDETGVKENLWLNLSTGFIGSGRQVPMALIFLQSRDSSGCTAVSRAQTECLLNREGSGGNGLVQEHLEAISDAIRREAGTIALPLILATLCACRTGMALGGMARP